MRVFVLSWRTQSQRRREREKDTLYGLRRSKREISRESHGRDGDIEQFAKYGAPRRMEPSRFCQIRNYECARTRACPGRCNISQYNTRDAAIVRSADKDRRYSTAARLELHLTTTTTKSLSNSCANGRELKGTAMRGLCRFRCSPGSLCKVADATCSTCCVSENIAHDTESIELTHGTIFYLICLRDCAFDVN